MPVSRVQKALRGHWSVVQRRADGYARRIPPDGVSRGRFVADVLTDVDPRFCDQVVEMLGRRGIVWLSRYRGEVTVYGEKPQARGKRELAGSKPIDLFLADVAPLLRDAAQAVGAIRPRGTPPEAEEACRVAVGRIIEVCRRKASEGLLLAEMREAMWSVLSSRLMTEIAFREPRLQQGSIAESFETEARRLKRLPNGLTPKAKTLAIVQRAGLDGITKSAIQARIQPRVSANDFAEIIGELETEGVIVWGEMRLNTATRSGVRLFSVEAGLPTVWPDGTMARRTAFGG